MARLGFLPAMFTTALIALPLGGASLADTVIPIADAKRGMMVTVAGTVERITDEDEFILTDTSDSIRVYVGPNWVPANVGDAVTVHGFIDNDLLRELYARTLTMPNGEVVTFERRYD
ncbi:hypothetical protein [Roseinatronobacter sp.]|uniref:hypothetical protein n=1 Tax=Roseinatronobacter sp. TaxID=1945755 RepID=UPI0025CE09E0|nr:hypothetical protein [Roseibaca sp.]